MFRFFRFIVFVLMGYKILRVLFGEDTKQAQRVPQTPPKQNINNNNWQQNQQTTPPPSNRFSDAEVIDYEEVK